MQKQIQKIREYLILAIIFLFPVTIANSFLDIINLPKLILLVVLICLILLLFAAEIYLTGEINISKGKFDFPVLAIIVAYLASAIFITPNKMEAFFLPGVATFVLGLGILYFLANTIANKQDIKKALIASSCLLSLVIITSFLGVFDKIPQLPSFIKDPAFNPAGDYITSTIFLLSAVPFAVFFLIKESNILKKLVFSFSLVFILVAAGISIFSLISPDKKVSPILPSFTTSWAVTIDTIREAPILGIGPGNYLTSLNRFRPASYNSTNAWQFRFSSARNWYLTAIAETGFVGLAALAILIITITKIINKNLSIYKESKSVMIDVISISVLVGILITLFFFPGNEITLMLVFALLAINSGSKPNPISLDKGTNTNSRLIISLTIIAAVLFLGFKARPIILGEAKFKVADTALRANDGKKTYETLVEAINLNPLVDRYHASYAQVNFAIAKSIIGSVKDTKNLTDDQKNTILQLIQQAIREGQNTVSLNPTRSANWQVLANIYQSIIGYANQADQYAIDSYNQTINLDPLDPTLKIALGSLYYSLGQYDNALKNFEFAIYAKPDFPNSYYNLAATYAAKNDFDNAILAMNKVISLVPKDSNDYKQAQNDLDTLQKKQKTFKENNQTGILTAPKKETQTINPKLQLPEEASPPAAPNIPTSTPKPTVTSLP